MKAGWKVRTLDELCTIARGGSPRPIQDYLTDNPAGVNWVKISDATASEKYIFETEQKIRPEGVKRSRLVYDGDFLLSNSMSFGRPYIMRTTGCVHDGWLVLSDKSGAFDRDYLYHFLGSSAAYQQFDRLAAGSTVRNLNIDLVRKVQVVIPPLEEQRRIVAVLDEAFAGIATATANAQKNLTNARAILDAHLTSIFDESSTSWRREALSHFMEITHGFAFDGADFSKSDDPSLPIVLTPGNYTENAELDFPDTKTKRLASPAPSKYIFKDGDLTVVMTDLSSKMKILGKPAFVRQNNLLHNQRIGRVFFKDDRVAPELVYYFMRSEHYLRRIKNTATGTMVRHTAPSRILAISMPFPESPQEQAEIVGSLDAITESIRDLECSYQLRLADLSELKQALLQKAFAGELT